jgi:NAD(P)H-flavin reductase
MMMKASLIPAIIDGPYGADGSIVGSYEEALFVVGGLGITLALPMMMSLCSQDGCTTFVRLVWSVKSVGEWGHRCRVETNLH